MKKLLLAIFIILPLGGCTVHGNKSLTDENHQTVKVKIVKGKTTWICPYISRHLLSLNPLLACCRRYSRGER
ncbi:hypothetical protein EA410_06440 [Escherichia coli]|nr:hypothetical protein EA410_06440 [Escherichia coli]